MPHIFKVFSISSALVRIKSDQVCNSLISWSRFKFPFYSRYVIRPGDHCHCLSLRISPTHFCLDVQTIGGYLVGSPTKATLPTWSVWEGNPPPPLQTIFAEKARYSVEGTTPPSLWTEPKTIFSKCTVDWVDDPWTIWLLERLGDLFVVYILTIDL